MFFLTPASPNTASAPPMAVTHLGANWPQGARDSIRLAVARDSLGPRPGQGGPRRAPGTPGTEAVARQQRGAPKPPAPAASDQLLGSSGQETQHEAVLQFSYTDT